MAISVINAAEGYDTSPATTIASNQNTSQTLNVQVGDLVYATVGTMATGSPTLTIADNAANTWVPRSLADGIDAASGNHYYVKAFYSFITTAESAFVATVTLTSSEIFKGLVLYQVRGSNLAWDQDFADTVGGAGAPSITSSAFSSVYADSIVFFGGHGSWSQPAGFYNVGDIAGSPATFHANGQTDTYGVAVEYRILSATVSGATAAMSADSDASWQMVTSVFGEVPAGPTAFPFITRMESYRR